MAVCYTTLNQKVIDAMLLGGRPKNLVIMVNKNREKDERESCPTSFSIFF